MSYIPRGCDQQDDDFAEDYTAMLTDISVAIVVIMVIGIIALLALGRV
jgi:hypothetical protein